MVPGLGALVTAVGAARSAWQFRALVEGAYTGPRDAARMSETETGSHCCVSSATCNAVAGTHAPVTPATWPPPGELVPSSGSHPWLGQLPFLRPGTSDKWVYHVLPGRTLNLWGVIDGSLASEQ